MNQADWDKILGELSLEDRDEEKFKKAFYAFKSKVNKNDILRLYSLLDS